MYCGKCGNEIKEGAQFCGACGAAVESPAGGAASGSSPLAAILSDTSKLILAVFCLLTIVFTINIFAGKAMNLELYDDEESYSLSEYMDEADPDFEDDPSAYLAAVVSMVAVIFTIVCLVIIAVSFKKGNMASAWKMTYRAWCAILLAKVMQIVHTLVFRATYSEYEDYISVPSGLIVTTVIVAAGMVFAIKSTSKASKA